MRGMPRRLEQFEQTVRAAIELELPYEAAPRRPVLKAPDGSPVPASVLISIGFDGPANEWSTGPAVLITRRTDQVDTHKGQMAFPGGRRDPEDRDAVTTALREAREEVGLDPEHLRVLGSMPELPTVTGFLVTPVVAMLEPPLASLSLRAEPSEIDVMLWVGLDHLRAAYRRESLEHGGVRYPIDVFEVHGHRIWGVTGTLLKNLLDRIARVG
jgi:8-oxo-dGTP pyrophosphatase MutT (NUDIX family)